jgi:hypothetical protein
MTQPIDNQDGLRGSSQAQQPSTTRREINAYPHDNHANGSPARDCPAHARAMPVGVSHYVTRDHAALGSLPPHCYLRTQRSVAQAAEEPLCGDAFADAADVRGAPGSHPAVRAARATQGPGHAMRDLLKHARLPRFRERKAGHSGSREQTRGQSGIARAY